MVDHRGHHAVDVMGGGQRRGHPGQLRQPGADPIGVAAPGPGGGDVLGQADDADDDAVLIDGGVGDAHRADAAVGACHFEVA